MIAAALEESREEWEQDAIATIIGIARAQEFLTADDLRKEMRTPAVANWIGLAFTAAKRAGHIESINSTVSKSKSRNHGSLKTWTRKVSKESAA